jgi:hypothetical protein
MENKQAAEHIEFQENLKNHNCENCNENNYRGIYILNNFNNVVKFNCLKCCKSKNLFELYKDYETIQLKNI